MLSRSTWSQLLAWVIALSACNGLQAYSQSKDRDKWKEDVQRLPSQGQKVFTSRCAPCHGLDGRGGKTAPNIVGNKKLERFSDAQILAIITDGIPGTGMPAFRSLGGASVHAVENYLRSLQGQNNKSEKLPGDATRGRSLFFGKGDCSSCHAVRGNGGFAGPDLTLYGADHSAGEIADAIIHPQGGANPRFKIATAVSRDGQRFRGAIRNEDNFSIQLQGDDGTFYLLLKSDLSGLQYESHSTMPDDYDKRLSRDELNDLVSYLLSVGTTEKGGTSSR